MPKVMRRVSVRKKERKVFLRKISEILGIEAEKIFGSKPQIEIIDTKRCKLYLINGAPLIGVLEGIIFPTLFFKKYVNHLPKVTVDMGAVPYICNGADVMAPGVIRIDGDFEEKALVAVIDERNKRPIAVVYSLFNSEKTSSIERGKVFRNLHYVGDEIWRLMKDVFRA